MKCMLFVLATAALASPIYGSIYNSLIDDFKDDIYRDLDYITTQVPPTNPKLQTKEQRQEWLSQFVSNIIDKVLDLTLFRYLYSNQNKKISFDVEFERGLRAQGYLIYFRQAMDTILRSQILRLPLYNEESDTRKLLNAIQVSMQGIFNDSTIHEEQQMALVLLSNIVNEFKAAVYPSVPSWYTRAWNYLTGR